MVEMRPSIGDRHGQRGIQVIVVRSVSGDDVARHRGKLSWPYGPSALAVAGERHVFTHQAEGRETAGDLCQRMGISHLADDLGTALPIWKQAVQESRQGTTRIVIDPGAIDQVSQGRRGEPCFPADRAADPDREVGQA